MKELVKLGKQIKQKRLSLDMSMEECAREANITRATLSSIENGKANCSITSLLKILDVLGLDLEIKNTEESNRKRATKLNALKIRKMNDFIIMCIEEYAAYINNSSSETYKLLKEKRILYELENDYEDLHGFSKEYLNFYIESLAREDKE